ncbi:MAG: rhodanese-like domain-containing protein [Verrucomicrobiota bacterium JB023]|nr:rhodanese-like domain-containing protein [Verrucomicrobiota bacterium JB023]
MNTQSPTEVASLLSSNQALPLDVRTPIEFSDKHIEGSLHHPVDQLADTCSRLDLGKRYVLVCQSGKRAEKAHHLLAAKGFHDLVILEGGVAAWEQANQPLTRQEMKVLPLMRQVQLAIGLGVLAFSLLAYFVNPAFAFGAAFFGAGLTLAGATGWCGLAILLSKMPWNRTHCDGESCCVPVK